MYEAKIGMQVICIKEFSPDPLRDQWETTPKLNQILTIRSLHNGRTLCLRFEEIINPLITYKQGPDEAAFGVDHFRPLLKTDISTFTAILEKPNKKIKAPEGPVRKRLKQNA